MLSINTNLSSLIAQNSMSTSTNKLNQAIERMTTGAKINHAKDNAANYSIATSWDTKLSSYDVAMDNAATGLDMLETASSNLELVNSHLVRLRDLAEQASNGTYGKQSLNALQLEAESRMKEITRIMNNAEFNGKKLFERQGGIAGMPKKTDGEFISKVERLSEEEAIAQGYTIIKTADELQAMNDDLDGKYILMNNIDLEGYDWEMIGDEANYFTGELNGNGFEIQNLFLDVTSPDPGNIYVPAGLFSYLDGTVKNLGITNADLTSHDTEAGILASSSQEQTNIDNCYVTGTVSGYYDVGGIVGGGYGNISNSWANVDVYSWGDGAGGIAGGFSFGVIMNCYAEGSVRGDALYTGGLVGWNEELDLSIENSYSLCSIEGNNDNGGILGGFLAPDSFINNCYWVGDDSLDVLGYIYPDPTWNGTITNAGCVIIDKLLGTGNVDFFVGISPDSSSIINLDFGMEISGLNFNLTDSDSARSCLAKIDNLLLKIGDKQVELGAGQARLESAIDSIETTMTNLVSSLSTVRDADIAEVSSIYIQQQILQQASATLMATANQSPAIALQLI